jgi:hypothetical protein
MAHYEQSHYEPRLKYSNRTPNGKSVEAVQKCTLLAETAVTGFSVVRMVAVLLKCACATTEGG